MYWTARDGTSPSMDGSVSRDGLDGLRWDGLAMDGLAWRDGLDGSQWDGLGNGGLGVAQWIGRLVMGRARQWMARRRAMNMNWTACNGLDARTG